MRSSPIQVGTGFYKTLALGNNSTMAIDPYGTLTAWGENLYGQLGTNSITSYSWTQLSNGDAHSLALRSDGLLYAWGLNTSGQLGTGDTIARNSPTQISANIGGVVTSNFVAVSAGSSHSVAISNDNVMYGWGLNTSGQVGDITIVSRSAPVQIGIGGLVVNYSVLFNGTSQYLSVPANTLFEISSAFTVEAWIYVTNTTGPMGIVGYHLIQGTAGYGGWVLSTGAGGILGFYTYVDNATAKTSITGSGINANSWQHVAFSYDGTSVRLFINGVNVATGSLGSIGYTGATLAIGRWNYLGGSRYLSGYISNARIVKGTVLYTTNFTPSVSPFSNIANTSLLTCNALTIVDGSSNALAITNNNGATVSSTVNPFIYYSGSFNGTTQSIEVANSGGILDFGTGNFTIEMWVYATSPTTNVQAFVYGNYNNGASLPYFGISGLGGLLRVVYSVTGTTSNSYMAGTTWNINTWYHVAMVRVSNTFTFYINGTSYSTWDVTGVDFSSMSGIRIGAGDSAVATWSPTYNFPGYVSNFRAVKGTAVYTGAFTPPTNILRTVQAAGTNITALSGTETVLLTCQNSTFIDNSINNFTITNNGSSTISSTIAPFQASAPAGGTGYFVASKVSAGKDYTLAIKNDNTLWSWGLNTSYQLGSGTTISRSSPTQVGTAPTYSIYLDGASYVTVPSTIADGLLGSGNYTIEFWCKTNDTSWEIFAPESGVGPALIISTGSFVFQYQYGVAGIITTSASSILDNAWHHVAVVRNSGTITVYFDGVSQASISGSLGSTYDYSGYNVTFDIGYGNQSAGRYLTGYLNNFRIVNGTAVYTSNFTVPTGPLTAIANTKLLTFQNSTLIDNSTSARTLGYSGTYTLQNNIQPFSSKGYYSNISAGKGTHSLATGSDGLLYGWGLGNSGQLGLNIFSWTQISSGNGFSTAIRNDGKLFGWGTNTSGQLGLGDTAYRSSPVQIDSGVSYISVSAGANQTLGIRSNNTLWGWGLNTGGQLGDTTLISRSSPVQIAGSWSQVNTGQSSTFGIKTDSTLWGWGFNNIGQLGDNSTVNKSSPSQVAGSVVSWSQISSGFQITVAIDTNYKLYAWGLAVANGIGANSSSPVIIGNSSWIAVAAGVSVVAAIDSSNRLFTWGTNTQGGLGDSSASTVARSSPVQVGTSSYTQITSYRISSETFGAITTDNILFTWGSSSTFQLGDGTTVTNRSSPVQIGSFIRVAGGNNFLAIDSNYNLWGWGNNGQGQLGLNDLVARSFPTQIGTTNETVFTSPLQITSSSFSVISAGYSHSTAITSDNRLLTWGNNTNGQLGSTMSFVSINAGNSVTSLLRSDGTVWNWGLGTSGQLGENINAITRSNPIQLGLLSNWSKITRPSFTNYAIDNTGKLYSWGDNSSGQLGTNNTINRSSPIQIGTSSWTMIATNLTITTGSQTAYAIRSDGALFVWGNNSSGQQGTNNNSLQTSSPVQVGSSSWSMVTAGDKYALAITSDGKLFGWGNNTTGQLGITPSTISWSKVGSSGTHTLAIRSDNKLFAWGLNTAGQLGDGTTVNKSSPVLIASGSYVQLSAGLSNSYVIRSDGGLFAWGNNSQGQLPLISQSRSSPVQIGSGSISSVYFGSSTEALSYQYTQPTGDFTIEAWVYITSLGNGRAIAWLSPTDQSGRIQFIISSTGALVIEQFGTGILSTTGATMAVGQWYHVAFVRLGTALTSYINGAPYATLVSSGTLGVAGLMFIGGTSALNNTGTIYMSNFRYVVGTAVYTGTFTPPTSSLSRIQSSGTNIAALTGNETNILTCQGSTIVDASVNNFVIKTYGPPRVDRLLAPFAQSTTFDSWSLISASQTLNYALAIKSDSTLYGWGNNVNGVIGNYSLQSLSNPVVQSPIQVSGGGSWNAVSAGGGHSLAVKSDFKLYTWGLGTTGQTAQAGPTVSWIQVAAGRLGTLDSIFAIRSDGALFAWGNNAQGQLGFGDTISRSSPVQLGSSSWSKVAASASYSTFAIRSDGILFGWGQNSADGVLGLGDRISRSSPTQIGSSSWLAIASGTGHTVGITVDGKLFTWGLNTGGALGDPTLATTAGRSSPVQIAAGTSWTSVATGTFHNLAIQLGGSLWSWGQNARGQLGLTNLAAGGDTVNRSSPVQITAIAGSSWSFVAAGNESSYAITNFQLYTWGQNSLGELGSGTALLRSAPVQVGTSSWVYVGAGTRGAQNSGYAHGITTIGNLYGWGFNTSGQIGDNTIVTKSVPTIIGAAQNWATVTGGIATNTSGGLFAWGNNTDGQLGQSDVVNRSNPIQLGTSIPTILSAPAIIGNSSWTNVSAGGSHSMAIRTDGGLFAWGLNNNGQLGLTDTVNRSSPVQVGTSSWSQVTAGDNHTFANLYSSNQLFAWGFNTQGQLGTGVTAARSSPVQINAYSSTTANGLTFNGTSQYLNGPTNIPLLTSGMFTIEAWINLTSYSNSPVMFGNQGWNIGQNIGFIVNITNTGAINMGASAGVFNTFPNIYTGTNTITLGTWTHIAITRDSSNVIRSFINGVVDPTTATVTQNLYLSTGTTALINVGARIQDGAFQPVGFTGQMSNLRIVPGVAVYTTTFTPPTTALAATQTAGTNIAAITGIPSNGYSVFFNGGQSLNTAGAPRFAAGTGDFTIEFWVFSCGTSRQDWLNILNTGNTYRISIYYTGTSIDYLAGTSSAGTSRISYTISTASLNNAWHHIALSRVSGSSRLYYDGNQVGSTFADTLNFSDTNMAFWLGKDPAGSTFMTGHLSNVRVIIGGTGLYSGTTLTIPTTSLTNITNTQMLTCQAATIIDGSTTPLTLTNTGTAIVTLAYSPFGTQATILIAQGPTVTSDNSINAFTFTNVASVAQSTVTPFVAPLTGVTSAGASTGAAVGSSGYLYVWGLGTSGQIGDNTIVSKSVIPVIGTTSSTIEYSPIQVGSSSWSTVSAGLSHTVGIKIDNTVYAWGLNSSGQLGDLSVISRSSPVQVGTGVLLATQISAGASHSATIDTNNKLFVWGINATGQLGLNDVASRSAPVQLGIEKKWYSISLGIDNTLATDSTNALFTWGFNNVGQLGLNDIANRSSPVQITALSLDNLSSPTQIGTSSWSSVSAGNNISVALTSNNKLFAWGLNTTGQLGTGVTFSRSSPVQLSANSYNLVNAGGTHITIVPNISPQLILSTGLNSSGQLGDISTISRSSPVQIGASNTKFNSPVTVSVGNYSSYYVSSPTQVGTSSWTTVSAGGTHTLGIKNDYTLWAWGYNANGQLGGSDTINRSSPVQIGTSSWTQVNAGDLHSSIAKSDGTINTFGLNNFGQLGDGT